MDRRSQGLREMVEKEEGENYGGGGSGWLILISEPSLGPSKEKVGAA